MLCNSKYILATLFFLSFFAFAVNATLVREVKNSDGSQWIVEKEGEVYNLKFINAKRKVYNNNSIITPDIKENNLFLNVKSNGDITLSMDYPRDIYAFEFSSEEIPHLLSACKQITLSSADDQQSVSLLTLCSKSNGESHLSLTDVDADKLLNPDNLKLNGKIKTVIGSDKAFIYDEEKKNKFKKPYLIKGDVVEILEYKNSMLKIKYVSKSRDVIGWIKFEDIL